MAHAPVPPEVQAALDQAACGLLRVDPYGLILRANAMVCDWLGYTREELQGRKLQDLLNIGGRIFHQTHLAPLLQIQGSLSEVKLEFVRRDGQGIPIVMNARRHEDGGEAVVEVALFVARDRDKYERELLLARTRLEDVVAQVKDRALLTEQMMASSATTCATRCRRSRWARWCSRGARRRRSSRASCSASCGRATARAG
jgi:sigma-B regulation protein RsbU (phosphoserine phosphatase)